MLELAKLLAFSDRSLHDSATDRDHYWAHLADTTQERYLRMARAAARESDLWIVACSEAEAEETK
jgi:predicted amidohydrolase